MFTDFFSFFFDKMPNLNDSGLGFILLVLALRLLWIGMVVPQEFSYALCLGLVMPVSLFIIARFSRSEF